jgi:hypothetical protein
LSGAIVSLLLLAVIAVPNALAVHDAGVFQLDGNAQTSVQSDPPADEDWDLICKANPDTCTFKDGAPVPAGDTTSTSSSHVDDGALNATIFHGSSKDTGDISTWRWKNEAGGLPDKDNLLHAYAARYTVDATLPSDPSPCPNGTDPAEGDCSLIYFGSDRYANDGDATQAFWFLQNRVTLSNPPRTSNGGFEFDGVHKNGDLLVISEFSNGGTKSTITVYTWQNGSLVFEAGGPGQKCGGSSADAFCGIVNESTTPTISPWTFLDKGGSTDFRQGEFFEAGINLSDPRIDLAEECFSSFVAETRSSTSTTATLKDFVLGQFEVCEADMVTAPSVGSGGSVPPGTPVHDIATVTGNNPNFTPSGTVTFFLCSPAQLTPANTGTCSSGGTNIGTGNLSGSGAVATANSPDVNTAASPLTPGKYCFRATWPGDVNYVGAKEFDGEAECFNVLVIATAISTTQSFFPNDSATVSTADNSDLPAGGSVVFSLYNSLANCQAGGTTGRILTESRPIVGGAPSETVATTNTTISVPPGTTLFWNVSYTTNSASYEGRQSVCTENTTLTITNDPGPGTAPA